MRKLLAAIALCICSIAAHSVPLENYFRCSLNEGKTLADAVQFLRAYQAAVNEKWDDYPVKILRPQYSEYGGPGKFVWFGGFDSADMEDIRNWFRASEWPSRFQETMTCESGSLWERLD